MTTCYIGIGSNIGDRRGYIEKAIEELKNAPGIRVVRVSSIYETDPVSDIAQGKFLNGVLEIETELRPRALLTRLNMIEERLDRTRPVRKGPRTIDLDILYYGDESVNEADLIIPHPAIPAREFVLKGLRELAPHLIVDGPSGEAGAA
jgi:2-amino-4-hydroxy-6-hydroxymethyldihydropteridine diphosphokinase